jgi:fatty acid desaturase
MLWLLPTRISSALFVIMFVFLPHAPFFATAKEDEYQASNIRVGWEWLLTPLMAYQNFHLAHHLYPRVPFYRLSMVWHSRLGHHLANDPFFVKAFSVGKKTEAPAYSGVAK